MKVKITIIAVVLILAFVGGFVVIRQSSLKGYSGSKFNIENADYIPHDQWSYELLVQAKEGNVKADFPKIYIVDIPPVEYPWESIMRKIRKNRCVFRVKVRINSPLDDNYFLMVGSVDGLTAVPLIPKDSGFISEPILVHDGELTSQLVNVYHLQASDGFVAYGLIHRSVSN